jgi:transcriptional regulator with XRE-family HTH domain
MTINSILESASWNEKIKMLRTSKGWTQEKAADMCGAALKAYWDWEKGRRYPRRNNRKAIANAYGVTEKELFS